MTRPSTPPPQLAELAGTSLDVVGAIEREVNVPTIETAAKLIGALDIDAGVVFGAQPARRPVSATRRGIEMELQLLIERVDDRGAVLLLDLATAVAKAHSLPALAEGE